MIDIKDSTLEWGLELNGIRVRLSLVFSMGIRGDRFYFRLYLLIWKCVYCLRWMDCFVSLYYEYIK